jgi:hypothetical protein
MAGAPTRVRHYSRCAPAKRIVILADSDQGQYTGHHLLVIEVEPA